MWAAERDADCSWNGYVHLKVRGRSDQARTCAVNVSHIKENNKQRESVKCIRKATNLCFHALLGREALTI